MSEDRTPLESYMDEVLYLVADELDENPDDVLKKMGHWPEAGGHAAVARCGYDMGMTVDFSAEIIAAKMIENGQFAGRT